MTILWLLFGHPHIKLPRWCEYCGHRNPFYVECQSQINLPEQNNGSHKTSGLKPNTTAKRQQGICCSSNCLFFLFGSKNLFTVCVINIILKKCKLPSLRKVCPVSHHLLRQTDFSFVVSFRPVERLEKTEISLQSIFIQHLLSKPSLFKVRLLYSCLCFLHKHEKKGGKNDTYDYSWYK